METKLNVQRCQNLNVFVFVNAPTKEPGIGPRGARMERRFWRDDGRVRAGGSPSSGAGIPVAQALKVIPGDGNTLQNQYITREAPCLRPLLRGVAGSPRPADRAARGAAPARPRPAAKSF